MSGGCRSPREASRLCEGRATEVARPGAGFRRAYVPRRRARSIPARASPEAQLARAAPVLSGLARVLRGVALWGRRTVPSGGREAGTLVVVARRPPGRAPALVGGGEAGAAAHAATRMPRSAAAADLT